jgi:LmbE family N-acetylglucosaminyl deacetylase
MQGSSSSQFRFLLVTAHPDDEAGGFGGTLALYSKRGVAINVVCLTAGTAARNRGAAKTNEELAAMRRVEFAASCELLGVSGEVLDYPDASLSKIGLEPVGDLVLRIRKLKPQVVLTFGPEGGLTGHLDHGMAGIFATLAFQWAARPERFPEQLTGEVQVHRAQKLYWSTAPFELPQRPPIALAPVTASIEIGGFFETKVRAFNQHTTQAPLFARFEENMGQMARSEHFHLAAASEPQRAEPETDLLVGVKE